MPKLGNFFPSKALCLSLSCVFRAQIENKKKTTESFLARLLVHVAKRGVRTWRETYPWALKSLNLFIIVIVIIVTSPPPPPPGSQNKNNWNTFRSLAEAPPQGWLLLVVFSQFAPLFSRTTVLLFEWGDFFYRSRLQHFTETCSLQAAICNQIAAAKKKGWKLKKRTPRVINYMHILMGNLCKWGTGRQLLNTVAKFMVKWVHISCIKNNFTSEILWMKTFFFLFYTVQHRWAGFKARGEEGKAGRNVLM